MTTSTPSNADDPDVGSGAFGTWMTDRWGLPAYEYTGNQPGEVESDDVRASERFGPRYVHLMGNVHWNVLCTAEGSVQAYESDRGPQLLLEKPGGWGVVWIGLEDGERFGDRWPVKGRGRRIFGTGYFRKIVEHRRIRLDHQVVAPPGDVRGLVSFVSIENLGPGAVVLVVEEPWAPRILPLLHAPLFTTTGRRSFGGDWRTTLAGRLTGATRSVLRIHPPQLRERAARSYVYRPLEDEATAAVGFQPAYRASRGRHARDSSPLDEHPAPFFLVPCAGPPPEIVRMPGVAGIVHRRRIRLDPGTATRWATGFTRDPPARFLARIGPLDRLMERVAADRRTRVVSFRTDQDPWLGRETCWHSAMVRGSTAWSEFFQAPLLHPGGARGYLHGAASATRDACHALIPLTYADPALARKVLLGLIRFAVTNQGVRSGTTGHGLGLSANLAQEPSDLPFLVLWAATEYLFATRDFAFLRENGACHDAENESTSVRARLETVARWLLDTLALGPNGLVRAGPGDWNPIVPRLARSRRTYGRDGESLLNTALALHVYPRLACLFEQENSELARRLRATADRLRQALDRAWTGKWYARAFDGPESPVEQDRLFLDHHVWLLVSGALAPDRAAQVVGRMLQELDTGSPIGAHVLHPPVTSGFRVPRRGKHANGGIWPHLNAILTWAYVRTGSEQACRSLVRNTLCTHAREYPDCWYGIWSGPECYNAEPGERAGEISGTFESPLEEFPVGSLMAHAAPLLAALKVAGIEASETGLTIAPSLSAPFEFASPLISLEATDKVLRLDYAPPSKNRYGLRIRLPAGWTAERARIEQSAFRVEPSRHEQWLEWPRALFARFELTVHRGA